MFRRRAAGLQLVDAFEFFKDVSGRFAIAEITANGVLSAIARADAIGTAYHGTKRLIDFTGAATLFILTLPVLVLAALAVKLDSKGPVFFIQTRLGYERRPFNCIKLRTMIADAESGTGPRRTSPNDSRITRVGGILRKLRIDELPQLINVLLGQMSLVGPRPIREHFVERWSRQVPFYDLRLLAAPGLTGWAQVAYDNAATNEDQRAKLAYDLYYLERQSITLDIYILIRTLRIVVSSRQQFADAPEPGNA